MIKKLTAAILALIIAVSSLSISSFAVDFGTTYYIDPSSENAGDSNAGTNINAPWKTLDEASKHIYSAGDKILLKKGETFNSTFTAKGNGTEENPIIIGSYGDESLAKPIIVSSDDTSLISLNNVSGWCVDGIEFTAPDGRGILIRAGEDNICKYITVKNCDFHDFLYVKGGVENKCRFPILIASSGDNARLRNVTVSNCSFNHCGYGIVTDGLSREWSGNKYKSPEESYNSEFIFENLSLSDILYDGVIVMSICGMVIRNSSFINTAMDTTKATAALWTHHADNIMIENCEIAGSANYHDGMTVDFDGWATNSTYQYIYSHDNQRFINNCCYDGRTRNSGCTVRYCLSVNDNKCKNSMAQIMYSPSLEYDEGEMSDYMDNFKFYNNTLINMGELEINNLHNSVIANNIFMGSGISYFDYAEKHLSEETGEPEYEDFDGIFSNNCLCGVAVPYISENNYICEPGFVGTDEADKNSYKLSSSSKLLGKGIKVEDDMGETDFYGNKLGNTHNIGCYEGNGENIKSSCNLFSTIKHTFMLAISSVYNFIETCNRRFWIF